MPETVTDAPVHPPATAYQMHRWQLDAWERQEHPLGLIGRCDVVRHPCLPAHDGWVYPQTKEGSLYILGWLFGRDSKP